MKRQICILYLVGLAAFLLYCMWSPGEATAIQKFNYVVDRAASFLSSTNASSGTVTLARTLVSFGLVVATIMAVVVVVGA
jgi:hypothetical protein